MVLVQTPKRPHSPHEKKRHGYHHKQGKHYTKTYWPYLPLLLAIGLGLIGNLVWSQHQAVLGAQSNITANSLLSETNAKRAGKGETALSLSVALNRAAQAKANDMVAKNYWSHDRPDGKAPWNFIEENGYAYAVAGENLAYGFASSDEAIAGWMNSSEHRANILNDSFSEAGFGIAAAPNYQGSGAQTVIVALYAQPASPSTATVLGTQTHIAGGQSVSRIQLLTGLSWSLFLVTFIAGACVAVFVVRHGVLLHRALVKSEVFVLRHRTLDLVLVIVGVGAFLLTRSSGFIQ